MLDLTVGLLMMDMSISFLAPEKVKHRKSYADELWDVVRKYIAPDTIQEYPIFQEHSSKMRKFDFPSENCSMSFE